MKKFLIGLVVVKILAAVLYCMVGFVHPHIIRQAVTLAVDQRFAIDWQHHDKELPWLPRSLGGGDKDAILEMEFPLLNYLTVPAFYFDPPTARVAARLICVFLFFGLWFYNYSIWKRLTILGISCELPSLILVLLPISGIYFQRFMPDFFSFQLCTIALGLSLREPKKYLTPLLFATLGLLEKPTSIIAFAPLLLLPNFIQQIRQRLLWLVPSTAAMLFFYTVVTKWIRSHSDLERYYMTDFRNPWQSLVEFFHQPKDILALVLREISTPALPLLVFLFWLSRKCPPPNRTASKLWGLLALQAFAIVLLDGAHTFVHSYYYIGLSLTAALLWTHYFQLEAKNKVWKTLMIAPLFLFNLEHSFYELRDGIKADPQSVQSFWQSCEKLKARHPEWPWSTGHSFRSEITPISSVGLCFGEIQSSATSPYGLFLADRGVPGDCQQIDQDGQVVLAKCQGVH